MRKYLNLLLFAVILYSCKKSGIDESPAPTYEDPAKAFLKTVKNDAPGEYYISGEFDGNKIYLASTLGEYYPFNDTGMNALYLNTAIELDNIHLVRQNREMSAMLAIYFDQAKIFDRTFPYLMPHANLAKCESVQFELINMKKLGTTGQGSPTDDFSFWGYTNSGSKATVTGFENNVMEGTFEGNMVTRTGSRINVKNGKFRIKILVFDMSNK